MDIAKFEAARAMAAQLEESQALGRFVPERQPTIDMERFDNIEKFTVAVSPDCSFAFIQEAIRQAQHEILLYIYNVSADYLIQLLSERKHADVKIRIMYDVTDTRGGERAKLAALGVKLKEAPSAGGRSVFTVCHQKFVVVDGAYVVVESANWATTSIPKAQPGQYKKGNREWLIRIDDRRVAKWFAGLFEADWDIEEMAGPSGLAEPALPAGDFDGLLAPMQIAHAPPKIFPVNSFSTSADVIPVISPNNYLKEVGELLKHAQTSIDIQQQYILAGRGVDDLLLILEERRSKGVTIRAIVSPAFEKNWKVSVDTLDSVGLKDCLKAINLDYFVHCHNKGVVVDGKSVVVSSTNWSSNSINKAREAGVLVHSAKVAGYYQEVFDLDWRQGIFAEDVADALVALHPADQM